MPIKIQQKNFSVSEPIQGDNVSFRAGRVTDVILDEEHPRAIEFGGFDAVGIIFYQNLERDDQDQTGVARPLFTFIKQYPLINEIVLINNNISKDFIKNDEIRYTDYYIPTLNLWNHPHHNILPDFEEGIEEEDKEKVTYQETEAGITNKKTNKDNDIYFGRYFQENPSIKPILPFEGDMILEGRFGNSIRFGSTNVHDELGINPWSQDKIDEDNGDPITIIRNGQSEDLDTLGFIPTIEDINNDNSCIYLTSNQNLPLNPASLNQKSYGADLIEIKTPLQKLTSPKLDETIEPEFEEDETPILEEEVVTQSPPTPNMPGCIDPEAINYNEEATTDDGSCEYLESNTLIESKTDTLKLPSTDNSYQQIGNSGPNNDVPELTDGLNQPIGSNFRLAQLISSGIYDPQIHPGAVYEKYRAYSVYHLGQGDPNKNYLEYDTLGFYKETLGPFIKIVVKDTNMQVIYETQKFSSTAMKDIIKIAENAISGAYTVEELTPPPYSDLYTEPYTDVGLTNADRPNNYPGFDDYDGEDIVFNLKRVISKCIDPIIANSPFSGQPLIIKSAYRSNALISTIGGTTKDDEHSTGTAIDFYIEGQDIITVWEWCYNNLNEWHQLMLAYPEKGSEESWIHVSYTNENKKFTTLASKDKEKHNMFGGEKREPNSDYQDNIKPINS